MNETTRSLAIAANNGFNGCSTDELRAYCAQLNITTKANSTDTWMVNKLNEAMDHPLVEQKPAPRTLPARPLNLRPTGKWEGRRRMVILSETSDQGSSWHSIAWDQNEIFVKTGIKVSIPYPHYEILKNAVHERLRLEPNGKLSSKEQISRVDTIPYQDLGDDPETLHLPKSWIERQQDDCRSRKYYKATARNILIRLLSEIRDGAIDREKLRDQSDEDIRETILNALGLYEEAQLSEYPLENAA